MAKIKTGWIVFATDASRDGVLAARAWLKETGLTPEDVRLYQFDGMTLAETLRPVEIALKKAQKNPDGDEHHRG